MGVERDRFDWAEEEVPSKNICLMLFCMEDCIHFFFWKGDKRLAVLGGLKAGKIRDFAIFSMMGFSWKGVFYTVLCNLFVRVKKSPSDLKTDCL